MAVVKTVNEVCLKKLPFVPIYKRWTPPYNVLTLAEKVFFLINQFLIDRQYYIFFRNVLNKLREG